MDSQLIAHYFPALTTAQRQKFEQMGPLYQSWNERINVISRKDIDALYEKHILHSLAIAKVINFQPASRILDVGTGGGFPGIPLAILFPNCQFTLIDSIGKKIQVVQAVSEALGLTNVTALQARVESIKEEYDFIVSRAVTAFPAFVQLTRKRISPINHNALPNGILYLKGGDFQDELKQIKASCEITEITRFFNEPFFETKKVIYLPIRK